MSHASVKQSASMARAPSLQDYIDLGMKMVRLSVDNLNTILRQTQPLLQSVKMPRVGLGPLPSSCCIPEQDCPPRCVCEVTWEAAANETVGLTVHLTNTSKTAREFQLQAMPFTGLGPSPGTILITPAAVTLASGQSALVNASFTVPSIRDGEFYSEIVIRGAYEQAVCVTLKVQCNKTCGDDRCKCFVSQGDPPIRIRAHQWYHHFQCVEQCVEPEKQGTHVKPHILETQH